MKESEFKGAEASGTAGGALSFPPSRVDAPAVPPPAPSVQPVEAFRILHVEDDPFVARLMREVLLNVEQFQFTVQMAKSLADGLECLAAGPVDVMLLDLSLPDSRGLDTVVRVRSQFPDVPIVVLSGHEDEGMALRAVKLGAQDYLVKGQADSRLIVRSIRYAMERKRADDELARERDLLHGILHNIPDRIYFKDTASRFVRVNQAMAEKFGLPTPAAAVGKTDFDFHPAADAGEFFADEQRLLQSGEPLINKVEGQTAADGSAVWASVTKVPMRDRHGRVTGLIGISRDITALKRLEASLVEERSLLRSLVDHLPDYIYVLDEEGQFIVANDSFCQLARHVTRTNPIGQTASALFRRRWGRTWRRMTWPSCARASQC